MQQIDPEEHIRQRPCSRPAGTRVQKDIDTPTLSFYQTFFKHASQDKDPNRCLFISLGPTRKSEDHRYLSEWSRRRSHNIQRYSMALVRTQRSMAKAISFSWCRRSEGSKGEYLQHHIRTVEHRRQWGGPHSSIFSSSSQSLPRRLTLLQAPSVYCLNYPKVTMADGEA